MNSGLVTKAPRSESGQFWESSPPYEQKHEDSEESGWRQRLDDPSLQGFISCAGRTGWGYLGFASSLSVAHELLPEYIYGSCVKVNY